MLEPKFRFNLNTPPEEYGGIDDDFKAMLAIVERQDFIIAQNEVLIGLLTDISVHTLNLPTGG